ncbi:MULTISPECIES: head decoration protein [Streptomyces]|uniref:Head decoration protein n=1 Tax=Streptomyces muensis TaxID=1077944 RepID=A0A9X1TP16_STRM4|nr:MULTISPECIES: head decoration protein [Streptomyces]MCF1598287.1 head decoration protein [Streptomyces muensis]QKV98268.1 head decoration protein [Streptomyces sp. NA02950]
MDIQPITTTQSLRVGRPWLLSSHGTETNQTITLDVAKFAENTHWVRGIKTVEAHFKSGLPLARNATSGLYEPYDPAATDGHEVLAGFLDTETAFGVGATRIGAALRIHGLVAPAKLPVAFDATAVKKTTASVTYAS